MKIFDDTIQIERNGKIFYAHWKNRHAPLIAAAPLILSAVGTGVAVAGSLEEGKQAEELAKERAAIDLENAEAVREASVEEAKIGGERRRRILATQKSQAAAGGVQVNVGSPLVIAAETRAILTEDIGFGLERGRAEALGLISSAGIERSLGRAARRSSRFDAIGAGVQGFGSIANMSRRTNPRLPVQGTFKAGTGVSQSQFGSAFISGKDITKKKLTRGQVLRRAF